MNKVLFETIQITVVSLILLFVSFYSMEYSAVDSVIYSMATFCVIALPWFIPVQLYEAKKISWQTKRAIQFLGLGAPVIAYIMVAAICVQFKSEILHVLDVLRYGMGLWCILILGVLIHIQKNKPNKEKIEKEKEE